MNNNNLHEESEKNSPQKPYDESLQDAFIIATNVRNFTRESQKKSLKTYAIGIFTAGVAIAALSGVAPAQVLAGFIIFNTIPLIEAFQKRNNMIHLREQFTKAVDPLDKYARRFIKDMEEEINEITPFQGAYNTTPKSAKSMLVKAWKNEPALTTLKLLMGIPLPGAAMASIVSDLDQHRLKMINGSSNKAIREIKNADPHIEEKIKSRISPS